MFFSLLFQVSAPLSHDWTIWIIQLCIICLMKILFEILVAIVICPSSYRQLFTSKLFSGHVHKWRWVFDVVYYFGSGFYYLFSHQIELYLHDRYRIINIRIFVHWICQSEQKKNRNGKSKKSISVYSGGK